jgi:hypothetical protein
VDRDDELRDSSGNSFRIEASKRGYSSSHEKKRTRALLSRRWGTLRAGIAIELLVLLAEAIGEREEHLVTVVGGGCFAVSVQSSCDLFWFEFLGFAATKGSADDLSLRFVTAAIFVMLNVLQHVVDQLRRCEEAGVPQAGELLPLAVVLLSLLVEIDRCLLRAWLLAVLPTVDVIIDPPDTLSRWTLEQPPNLPLGSLCWHR